MTLTISRGKQDIHIPYASTAIDIDDQFALADPNRLAAQVPSRTSRYPGRSFLLVLALSTRPASSIRCRPYGLVGPAAWPVEPSAMDVEQPVTDRQPSDAHQQGRAPAQHHDSYALQQAVVASNDANVLSRLLPNQFSP